MREHIGKQLYDKDMILFIRLLDLYWLSDSWYLKLIKESSIDKWIEEWYYMINIRLEINQDCLMNFHKRCIAIPNKLSYKIAYG